MDEKIKSIESRIDELEKDFLKKRYADTKSLSLYALSVITIIVLLIGFFSFTAKREVSEAVREMKRDFERLAGQQLKEPKIDIAHEGVFKTGETLTLKKSRDQLGIGKITIQNNGSRRADIISAKFYFSLDPDSYSNLRLESLRFRGKRIKERRVEWELQKNTINKEYMTLFIPEFSIPSLSPQEPYSFPHLLLQSDQPWPAKIEIKAKFSLFYGPAKPANLFFNFAE